MIVFVVRQNRRVVAMVVAPTTGTSTLAHLSDWIKSLRFAGVFNLKGAMALGGRSSFLVVLFVQELGQI